MSDEKVEKVIPRYAPGELPQEKVTHEVNIETIMNRGGASSGRPAGDNDPIRRSYFDSPGFKESGGKRMKLDNKEVEQNSANVEDDKKNDAKLELYDCFAGCRGKQTVSCVSNANNLFQCSKCDKMYKFEE